MLCIRGKLITEQLNKYNEIIYNYRSGKFGEINLSMQDILKSSREELLEINTDNLVEHKDNSNTKIKTKRKVNNHKNNWNV